MKTFKLSNDINMVFSNFKNIINHAIGSLFTVYRQYVNY